MSLERHFQITSQRSPSSVYSQSISEWESIKAEDEDKEEAREMIRPDISPLQLGSTVDENEPLPYLRLGLPMIRLEPCEDASLEERILAFENRQLQRSAHSVEETIPKRQSTEVVETEVEEKIELSLSIRQIVRGSAEQIRIGQYERGIGLEDSGSDAYLSAANQQKLEQHLSWRNRRVQQYKNAVSRKLAKQEARRQERAAEQVDQDLDAEWQRYRKRRENKSLRFRLRRCMNRVSWDAQRQFRSM